MELLEVEMGGCKGSTKEEVSAQPNLGIAMVTTQLGLIGGQILGQQKGQQQGWQA